MNKTVVVSVLCIGVLLLPLSNAYIQNSMYNTKVVDEQKYTKSIKDSIPFGGQW